MTSFSKYDWGRALNFTIGGNAIPYLLQGWAIPEDGLVWTNELNARLGLSVKPADRDITLILQAVPFLGGGKLKFQELHVYVNFLRVGFFLLSEGGSFEVVLPKTLAAANTMIIDLYIPRACSPFELDIGPDIRHLGLAVSKLTLVQT